MLDFRKSSINSALRKVLKRFHYPLEVMLTCVRWYVAYPLSLRHVEEMMQERGVFVDHSTVHRWVIKMLPVLAAVFRRRKHPVDKSWRMDETYIKVAGEWKYLYRAVDRAGDTADFLQTAKGDLTATGNFCLFLKDKCHVSVYKSNSGLSNGKKVKPSQTICAMPVVTAIAVRKSTFLYLAKPIGTC